MPLKKCRITSSKISRKYITVVVLGGLLEKNKGMGRGGKIKRTRPCDRNEREEGTRVKGQAERTF